MAAKIEGQVVAVANGGNLVTNITAEHLEGVPRDERVTIYCDGHVTLGIFPVDHQQPEMTLLALLGTGRSLELTIVGENASAFLGIRPGARITVSWS